METHIRSESSNHLSILSNSPLRLNIQHVNVWFPPQNWCISAALRKTGHNLPVKYTMRLLQTSDQCLGNLDPSSLWLWLLNFWNCHCQYSILHLRLYLVQICVLRESDAPQEAAMSTLNAMPFVTLLHLLFPSFATDLQSPAIHHLHFHFLFLQSWKIRFEYVCLRGFPPVNLCVGHRVRIHCELPRWSILHGRECFQRIPDCAEGQGINDTVSTSAKVWESHCPESLLNSLAKTWGETRFQECETDRTPVRPLILDCCDIDGDDSNLHPVDRLR